MSDTPQIAELVGTKQKLGGGLFSGSKTTEPAEYDVLDWRWGSATLMNMETFEEVCPTVELLVKREGMKRSRWTRGFAARDYQQDKDGNWVKKSA